MLKFIKRLFRKSKGIEEQMRDNHTYYDGTARITKNDIDLWTKTLMSSPKDTQCVVVGSASTGHAFSRHGFTFDLEHSAGFHPIDWISRVRHRSKMEGKMDMFNPFNGHKIKLYPPKECRNVTILDREEFMDKVCEESQLTFYLTRDTKSKEFFYLLQN